MTLRVHLAGDYAHRQPLAYAPIRAALGGRIEVVEGGADLIVVAHPKDIAAHGARLAGMGRPVALLSEEPFWDTIWGGDPRVRDQVHGDLPHAWLNHRTSAVFDFDRIPYFLLTDARFAARYARLFARNAARSAADWRARFTAATRVVFMAERRRDPKYDRVVEPGVLFGLAARRTRIAEACKGDHVERLGHGWGPGVRRQDLADWHLDKIERLDGRARVVSAIENTHDPLYVTEKIFDAFAVGALPLYVAAPGHRLRDLLPEGSWLDLHGMSDAEAGEAVAGATVDAARLDAWRAAQDALARLFGDADILAAEHERLATALVDDLTAAADALHPAPVRPNQGARAALGARWREGEAMSDEALARDHEAVQAILRDEIAAQEAELAARAAEVAELVRARDAERQLALALSRLRLASDGRHTAEGTPSLRAQAAALKGSPLFDEVGYRTRLGIGRRVRAEEHYVLVGAFEGIDPGPGFSTLGYYRQNPDVLAAGWAALVHYVMHGAAEGRGWA